MTEAVSIACSKLSFSRMSFINSTLLSVIFLNSPSILNIGTVVPLYALFSVYTTYSELSTNSVELC